MKVEHYVQRWYKSFDEIRCPHCRQKVGMLYKNRGFEFGPHGLCNHVVVSAASTWNPEHGFEVRNVFVHRTEYRGAHADSGDWYKFQIPSRMLDRAANKEQSDTEIRIDWGKGVDRYRLQLFLSEQGKTVKLRKDTKEEYPSPT